ncbi:MAG: hypothetical protein JWM11_1525 [Planctomycetaceae bacterium]|nr:hypothetical protein [Planctomycetaceae bacterium]
MQFAHFLLSAATNESCSIPIPAIKRLIHNRAPYSSEIRENLGVSEHSSEVSRLQLGGTLKVKPLKP